MPLSKPDGIYQAETEQEREAVYRFRYEVYVEEMGRYRDTADHDNRRFWEPCDDHSRIGYALENGEVVATGRFTWGGHGPLPERQIRQYSLEPFLDEQTRARLRDPRVAWIGLAVLFFVFFRTDAIMRAFMGCVDAMLKFMGLPFDITWRYFNIVLFGRSD